MEVYRFLLWCTLLAFVAAFTIPDSTIEHGKNASVPESAASENCKCKNGRCVTDNRGKTKCNCAPGYALQDEFTCEKCYCGKKGRCIFMPQPKSSGGQLYQKKCICDVGSAEKDGICIDCHCGEHSKCEFEGEEKVCYCIERFSEKDGVCTECDCGFFGECKFEMGRKICSCDEGYVEEKGRCRAICDDVDCGWDAECQFDAYDRIPKCICKDSELTFDVREKKCKGQCHDASDDRMCLNAGVCQETESGNFCSCKDGTSGFYCETVDGCLEMDCGKYTEAVCVFDFQDAVAKCKCIAPDHIYYEIDKKCKEKCSADRPCHNGGECEAGKCHCHYGTSGDFCDVIDECVYLCPQQSDIECYYDLAHKKAFCKCAHENFGYHPETRQCRPRCDDYSYICMNNGKCEASGFSRFCHCLPGTEGDFCEKVPECDIMECGTEAECAFDAETSSAICICHDRTLSFDPWDKRCKNTCSGSFECQNGGVCEREGYAQFCRCLDGVAGDFCEDVVGCKAKDCGDHAKCVYDVDMQIAVCVCDDIRYAFDPVLYKCRMRCDDYSTVCVNGGVCEVRGGSKFCKCLTGTEGDLCEKVPVCESKDCGLDAECQYDSERGSAICICHHSQLSFDSVDNRCRRRCDDYSSVCVNGGVCEVRGGSNFCKCLTGTEGDLCEKVPLCESKDCGLDAECQYDSERGSAICICHDNTLSFDSVDNRCRKSCQEDTNCKNGGQCTEQGDAKFCLCLPGTYGDACENVKGCEEGRKCKGESQCIYDISKKTAFCQCHNHSKTYDPLNEKCKIPCHSNGDCKHRGLCMQTEDHSFCRCKIGTSGELCEIIDGCKRGACGNTNATICKYDIEKEIVKCECKDAAALYDEVTKTCRTCDCGKNAISCKFEEGKKVCKCPEGFGVENGVCKKKWCVKKTCLNGKCEIIDDREVCSCFEGYELDGNYCKKLNCTNTPCFNGTCVVRHGNVEECVCPAGFTLNRGACIRGLCRPDTCFGGRCETIDGELICVCPHKFHLEGIGCFETVCEIQRCFGGKCVVEDGKEICTCREGYILENDVCKKILCEKKNCFGGQCLIVDGEEECTCPAGFSIFEDVCREDLRRE